MSVIGHSPLAGASGAAGGADPLYVDDVFSTFLYDGTGSGASPAVGQTINNGIDLSGEGGMVWFKNRDYQYPHRIFDTERGANKYLESNSTGAEVTATHGLTAFNSNGFTIGTMPQINEGTSGYEEHVSWTFRKAPGFFDIVTYNGTGSNQTISHSLGSVPGMIIIHCRDGTHNWEVYHRSTGATKSLHLNTPDTPVTDSTVWNNTTPTSSVFTVGTSSNVNQNGHGYVAYVFAHDEQAFGTDEDKAIIKCGTYTGNGGNQEINIGFEAQWLLMRNNSIGTNWFMVNNMMGDKSLVADESGAEVDNSYGFDGFKANGFAVKSNNANFNASGSTYIYMAIRRPHKPPTAGTEVFAPQTTTPEQVRWTPGFAPDALFTTRLSGTNRVIGARLTGAQGIMYTNLTNSEESGTDYLHWDEPTGTIKQTALQSDTSTGLHFAFKRAPGFFDVVAYTGTGSAASVAHNLEATPQLLIIKKRSAADSWVVYTTVIDSSMDYMYLNSTAAKGNSSSGLPTSTVFNLSAGTQVNGSGIAYISYLFATLDGISKVGTYSGTGSNINVDCGFTAGARFILIKRTDSAGDWYVWDTLRGIVSGNDPYLLFNSTAAQVTNTDYIDPLNAGFTVTSSAPAALNTSGGTYLFFAIA